MSPSPSSSDWTNTPLTDGQAVGWSWGIILVAILIITTVAYKGSKRS